ncbi:MAG: poly(R)-hydroxyalkanoic acid synthase subunit PhaE [Amphritea sp.]
MTDDFKAHTDSWLTEQITRWQALVSGTSTSQSESWMDLINKYQGASQKDLPQQHAELLNMVSSQSARFTAFAESLLQQQGKQPQIDSLIEKFQHYMHQQTTDMLSQQWNLPEPLASLLKNQPLSKATLTEGPLREYLEKLALNPEIASPGTGHNPFSQIQIRDGAKALLDYQNALSDYIQQYELIFSKTGEQLKQSLQQDDTSIDSIKQLHNLWVDCYEQAYADTVFTDTYQECHGRVSNTLMQVQKLAQEIRDSKLKEYGFVTQAELNNTLKQQHKMRKQMRQQQTLIDNLQQQLQNLQQELQQQLQAPPAQKSPRRKKTP